MTLIEILLVLAILALIAATAWPSLERSLSDQRLRDAADMVRAEWQHARAKAMDSGVAYKFCYMPDDRTFWIEPCEETADGSAASTSTAAASADSVQPGQLLLPEHVMFAEGKIETESTDAGDEPDEATATEDAPASSSPSAERQSDESIVFAPDGTCSSAELTLRNDHDRGITVSIHGLTAIAVVGEVSDAEEGLR